MPMIRERRFVLATIICLLLVCGLLYVRPVPLVQPTLNSQSSRVPAPETVSLPWPNAGQGAIGAVGYGMLASSGNASPLPLASTAKIMTALAVLDKKPLMSGEQGPLITISASDVEFYQQAKSQGESVVPVYVGEQLTEYQALQALLIPSANNIAYTLANWAFGSLDDYLAYANQRASMLKLSDSHFDDASGISPKTAGTAEDLIRLGQAAMKNQVISSIVKQPSVDLPVVGTVKNVNWLLGTDGIIGIKTGNSDEAGGCFLLAAERSVGNQKITVLTSSVGAPDLTAAMISAKDILNGSNDGFFKVDVGESSSYKTKWGKSSDATGIVSLVEWRGLPLKTTYNLKPLPAGSPKGTLAGYATESNSEYSKTSPMYLQKTIEKPSVWWRIFHW